MSESITITITKGAASLEARVEVTEVKRRTLAEDDADSAALNDRRGEGSVEFGAFVQGLRRAGRL